MFRKNQPRGGKVINFCFRKVCYLKITHFRTQNRPVYFLAIYSQTISSRNKYESVIGRYWWYLYPWCIKMTVRHSGRTQQFPKDTLFLAAETTIWVTASQCFSYRYTSIYSLSFWSWINYEHTIERYFFPLLIWYIKLLVHPFDRTQSSQTEVNRVMAPFQNRKGNCSCMLSELLLSFKK